MTIGNETSLHLRRSEEEAKKNHQTDKLKKILSYLNANPL